MNHSEETESLIERLADAERRISELEAEMNGGERTQLSRTRAEGEESSLRKRPSRRELFKLAGSAAAGATAIALVRAEPATASDGNPITIGSTNTGEAQTTLKFDGTAGSLTSTGNPLPLLDLDASTSATVGVGSGGSGFEAIGDVGNTGVLGAAAGGVGVLGATTDLGGVAGEATSSVFGGLPDYGIDLVAIGNGNIGQFALPAGGLTNGAPNFSSELAPTGFELVRNAIGGLWSSDSTGAFHPVLSVVPLPAPVRVINTTDGTGGISGPLGPSSTPHISAVIAGTNGIPTNAVGVVGNFAVSGVGGALLNGFGVATIFPAGVATPATANINAGSGCFAISNAVTVAFGTGGNAGKVSVVWGGGGPVPHVHAFLDVIGYLQ